MPSFTRRRATRLTPTTRFLGAGRSPEHRRAWSRGPVRGPERAPFGPSPLTATARRDLPGWCPAYSETEQKVTGQNGQSCVSRRPCSPLRLPPPGAECTPQGAEVSGMPGSSGSATAARSAARAATAPAAARFRGNGTAASGAAAANRTPRGSGWQSATSAPRPMPPPRSATPGCGRSTVKRRVAAPMTTTTTRPGVRRAFPGRPAPSPLMTIASCR